MADATAIAKARDNATRALAQLREYVALPIQHNRDKPGIIQAFEFSFEATWKLFQKRASAEGLSAEFPKKAIGAALKMGFVEDEELWLAMLDARNTTSDTYRQDVADAICQDIVALFCPALSAAIARESLTNSQAHGTS